MNLVIERFLFFSETLGILLNPFNTALIYKPDPPTIIGTFLSNCTFFKVVFRSNNQSATEKLLDPSTYPYKKCGITCNSSSEGLADNIFKFLYT